MATIFGLDPPPPYGALGIGPRGGMSKEESSTLQRVRNLHELKPLVMRPLYHTWILTHAVRVGNAYLTPAGDGLFQVPRRNADFRVRVQVGLPAAYATRTKARLTTARPEITTAPASISPEDIRRAQISQGVMDFYWDYLKMQAQIRDGVDWMTETGTGILEIDWNREAGPKGADGEPIGDHEVRAGNPYNYLFDPNATTFDECEWFQRDYVKSLRWIVRNFPERGKMVKAEEIYPDRYFQQRQKNMIGIIGSNWAEQLFQTPIARDLSERSIVVEHFEKPTRKHPDGRLIIIANQVILYDGPNPYRHRKFPIVMWREIDVPGRPWGQSRSELGNQLIMIINRVLSSMVETANWVSNPKVLIPMLCQIQQDAFNHGPGEKVFYNAVDGAKPEPFQPGQIPQSQIELLGHILRQYEDTMGFHEVSRGAVPQEQPRSGRIVSLLQNADETMLAPVSDSLQDALTEAARMILSNTAQFCTESRIARITGRSDAPKVFKFQGRDLIGPDPLAEYFDVKIKAGVALPRDRSSIVDEAERLMQSGMFKPDDPRLIAMMERAGYGEQLLVEQQSDRTIARLENDDMDSGKPSEIMPIDDDMIHMEEHRIHMKGAAFRMLPPWKQKLHQDHYGKHEAQRAMKQMPPMPPGAEGAAPAGAPASPATLPMGPGAMPQITAPPMAPGANETGAMALERAADLAAGGLTGISQ